MTPLDSASFATATPVGLSSSSTTRTLAPALMSAVARLSSVASLPCALSILNCELVYPASVKASFRYGASKSTYRVDDVVSGMITPTCRLAAPLVAAAVSGLSWDIVDAMSTVKELVPSPDGIVAEPLLAGLDEVAADAEVEAGADADGEDEVDDDEQPAATTAATAARATQPSRGSGLNVPWRGEREGRR